MKSSRRHLSSVAKHSIISMAANINFLFTSITTCNLLYCTAHTDYFIFPA